MSCHGSWDSHKRLYSLTLCLHVFSQFSVSLLFFCFWEQSAEISHRSPQTHKTKPCSYNCVICFSFVIEEPLLSRPTNKHKFRREKREKKALLSYYYFKLHHFLSSCLILFFPLLFSSCSLSLFTPCSVYTAFTKTKLVNLRLRNSSLNQMYYLFI